MDVDMEANENSPNGSERRIKSERRTSILKPPKPRNPLQVLDFDNEANEAVQPTRRVSFSRAHQIQEFEESRGQHIWGPTYYVDVCQSDSSIKNATSSDAPELDQALQFESMLSDVNTHSVKDEKFEIYQKEDLTNCSDSIYIDRNINSGMEITDCVENVFIGESSIIENDNNETQKTRNVDDKSNRTKIFNSSSDSNNMELTMKNDVTSRQSQSLMQNSRNCTKIYDCSSSCNKINLTGDYGIFLRDSICESNNSKNLVLCDNVVGVDETSKINISNNFCLFSIKNVECNTSNDDSKMLNSSCADNSVSLSEIMGGIVSDSGDCVMEQDNPVPSSDKIETIEAPFKTSEMENQKVLHLTEACVETISNGSSLETLNDSQAKISNDISLGNEQVIEPCSVTSELSPECLNVVQPQLDALRTVDNQIVSLTVNNTNSLCMLTKEIGSEPTTVNQDGILHLKIQDLNLHSATHLKNCKENFSDKESENRFYTESKNLTNENSELNNARDQSQNNSCILSVVNVQDAYVKNMDLYTDTHLLKPQNEFDISNNEITNRKAISSGQEKPITNNCENNQSLPNNSSDCSVNFLDGSNIVMTSYCANNLEIHNINEILTEELPRITNENISTENTSKSEKHLNNPKLVSYSPKLNNSDKNSVNNSVSYTASHETCVPMLEIRHYSNENEKLLNQTSNFSNPKDNNNCEIHATAPNLTLSYQQLIENGDSELEIVNNSSETSIIFQTSRKRPSCSPFYLASIKKNMTENHLLQTTKEFGDVEMAQVNDRIQYLETSEAISSSKSCFDTAQHSSLIASGNKKFKVCKTHEAHTLRDILDMQMLNSDLGSNFTDDHKHHEIYIENESNLYDLSISSSSPDDDWKCSKEIDIIVEVNDKNVFKRKAVESAALWGTGTNIDETPLNLEKHLIRREMITPAVSKETNNKLGINNLKIDGFCSMQNLSLTESKKQQIESKVRRKINQSSQITRFESLKEQYKEFSKKHQTLMYKIKSLEKCKIQSVASDCNPFNDTSIFYDFDNSLYLTKGPLSAKDYIVSFKESNKCIWELERMSEKEWIFSFLNNMFTLVVRLEDTHIIEIKFLPIPVGDDEILKFIQHVVIKSFSSDKIVEMCKTESDVIHLLNEISGKIEDMLIFKSDIKLLHACYMLEFFENCASLKFQTFKSLLRFKLTIDLKDWNNIQPEHISVNDSYGNLSVHDVVSLASGIQKDSHFLLNYIKAIHEYLKVLDKYVQ